MKILLSVSAIALASVMGAGAAYAADLMVDDVAIEAATAGTDWSGAYVGANAGAASGTVEWEFVGVGGGDEYDISGWTLGGQIGYNWQMDNIVFGLEADLSVAAINGEFDTIATRDINWVASARGRVGYAIDSILIYGTAGLAVANSTGTLTFGPFGVSETNTHIGWTAGLGVEAMVADNVSVKAEYRFSDYGSEEYYGDSIDTSFSTHTVQVGVNFHF